MCGQGLGHLNSRPPSLWWCPVVRAPTASSRWRSGWSPHSSQCLQVPTCVYLKGNFVFQVLEEPVYELVVKQLKQHQNTLEDKFIMCLSRATKNFPPLADRWGWCLPACWGGSCAGEGGCVHLPAPACGEGRGVLSAPACQGQSWWGSVPLRSPALAAAQIHEQRALPAAEVPRRDEDTVSGGGAVSCGGDP